MDRILRGTDSYAGVYLDDILVHSRTWHLLHLTEIIHRLSKAGLTVNLSKCTFGATRET